MITDYIPCLQDLYHKYISDRKAREEVKEEPLGIGAIVGIEHIYTKEDKSKRGKA